MQTLRSTRAPLERLMIQCHRCLHQPTRTTTVTTSTTTSTSTSTSTTTRRSAHHFRRKSTPLVKKYAIFKDFGKIPPYPYGPSHWFKQSNRALYGGARVSFGNNVSKKNEIKTRRRWGLNSQRKQLYSKVLDRKIKVRLTVKVMKTIEKVGGLDEYLLGHTAARIKGLGPRGWALRWRLMQEPSVKERIRRERAALGIVDADADADADADGVSGNVKAKALAALRRSPEDLARMDYEKIVRDKAGKLLGTEPGRWRLLHVLYMKRLKEQRENIAVLDAEAAEAAVHGDGSSEGAIEARHEGAVAEEVRKIDEALDAEEKMPDEEGDDVADAEKEDLRDEVEKKSTSSSSLESDGETAKGKATDKTSKPWSEKRAGKLEVHPDLLEATERGEQPRSSL